MLEDDPRRVERFRSAAARGLPGVAIRVWASAHAMIAQVPQHVHVATLISLDHDLVAPDGEPDPGDGVVVAKFLVSQPIVRPVIVHTSNAERGRWMMGEFELARWPHARVLPIGDRWIEDDWIVRARALLAGPRGTADE